MTILTKRQFQAAREFIQQNARPLEQALYAYHFENGSRDVVLRELAQFQNEDGGFGHALEPDLRLSDSSVIATTIAFQRLREIDVPVDNELVGRACQYILNEFDEEHDIWQIIPQNVDDAPHAFWWTYRGDPQKMLINPRAEIVGYLYDYPEHFPADLRTCLTTQVLDHLASYDDGEMEMHDLQCYVRLLNTKLLPPDIQQQLLDKLTPILKKTVSKDPNDWQGYTLPPIAIVRSPESLLYPLFAASIVPNLQFVVDHMQEDTYWSVTFSWEKDSPDSWQLALKEWQGITTLRNLVLFNRFDLIE